ncbi:MND1-interacting protein 1-like isoform X1 [Glycine soja]|uniref:MND1-interacting protein 1 n=1 Tax=Glycine soja TaxID=3848 RepID=A0A445G764_GLYSO|nr:MND1-interacting protein 1-like isoform X1 [Glycine soja]KHN01685.1 MND1-interacting protein 1 [Glycine soja]RZB57033.1 MND1-interacting protein 1 [Glycine soja]
MGCTMREKHIRANRRPRSVKPDPDSCDKDAISKSIAESGLKPFKYHLGLNDSSQSPNSIPNAEETGWGYCTEEQLEEILLKNLEFIYNEAVSKLVALGYDEDVAVKAILRNGHCYGGMDVLTNILHNSLAFLNSNSDSGGGGGGASYNSNGGNLDESDPVFSDLRQLEEYSLAGMLCLLQQVRPHLSKGDAMWCLLMSDLHVGRASAMEIPEPGNGSTVPAAGEVGANLVGAMAPALCRFHGGWGFGSGGGLEFPVNGIFSCGAEMNLQLQRDIEFPKRFNLSPSMKSLLKRNVAMFAAGFRANSKQLQAQVKVVPGRSTVPSLDSSAASGTEVPAEQSGGNSQNLDSQDAVNSVQSKFGDLNLDENLELVAEDQKDEVIVTLFHQIKDLEKQVSERKDWAHQKAMQAARKLSSDLTELKMLRMEREETQKLKKGKPVLEDTTMKRLSEMENALRKASGQLDLGNAAVRRLETENAEMKAEMEASKLSASESVTACLEVAKREKKCLKKLLAWEKQKAKLQQEISDEKEKILKTKEILVQIRQCQKEAEVKWKEELKAKEEALALVEEERHCKEAAESNNKRKLEALRLKIEIDFQRHKDDLLRLEQELSRLKASAQSAELHNQSSTSPTSDCKGAKPQRETIARLLQELDNLEDFSEKEINSNRECIVCMKDEVSIVFLPCAHQVMCASCSDEYGRKGKATCPCCRVQIQQRIRVFGASS